MAKQAFDGVTPKGLEGWMDVTLALYADVTAAPGVPIGTSMLRALNKTGRGMPPDKVRLFMYRAVIREGASSLMHD